jgi:hypothetical protein
LRIEIFDHEKSGKHVSMGEVQTSVNGMLANTGCAMTVIEPAKKAKKASYSNSGSLTASSCVLERHPTFADVSYFF